MSETDKQTPSRKAAPAAKKTRSSAASPERKAVAKRATKRPAKKPAKKPAMTRAEKLQRTRVAILESALTHFAKRGFEGASTRDIAESAGVQHGMIRHIYGSKDDLWRQVIAYLFERMHAEMAPILADMMKYDDEAVWRKWVAWYIRYCARHPEHARLMIQQSIMEGPRLEWAAQEFIRSRHLWHFPWLERMKAKRLFPDVDSVSLFFMITASCQMVYVLAPEIKAVDGRDVFDPEQIERHIDAVCAVFLRP
jgi:AcrR family transcriptional regulator